METRSGLPGLTSWWEAPARAGVGSPGKSCHQLPVLPFYSSWRVGAGLAGHTCILSASFGVCFLQSISILTGGCFSRV